MANLDLEKEVITEIAAGESYIIHPPIKGKICIWVNCDKEMQIKLDTEAFKKAAVALFKQIPLTSLLTLLTQGETLYIDAYNCKPLKSKKIDMKSPIPSLKEVLKQQKLALHL